jgi:hypothetical protein
MSTDDADYIARNMKKGGMGALLFILGMANAAAIGGYYIYGEKRKVSDVKPGEISIFGVKISHLFLHHPAIFGPLMLGATMMRVIKQHTEYNRTHPPDMSKGIGVGAGLEAGAWGVAQGVPFIDTPMRLAESKKDDGKFWRQFAEGLIVPPDVRRISKAMDKAGEEQVPREQKTLKQTIQGSIPGQRSKLPLDMTKIRSLPLDRMADVIENAPQGTFTGKESEVLANTLDRKLNREWDKLTPAERSKYDFIIKKLDNPEKFLDKSRARGVQ